jgi:hypothetical protein
MSLKEDLMELAQGLDRCRHEPDLVREIAAELRGMSKALPDEKPAATEPCRDRRLDSYGQLPERMPLIMPGKTYDDELVNKVRQLEAEARQEANAQEADAQMILATGGPLDGDYIPIDPKMPTGARTNIGGAWYVRRGASLAYCEELSRE